MKVDFSELDTVVVQNKDGDVVDRFRLSYVTLGKTKLQGNTLILQKE